MQTDYDLIVIGAGASGLIASVVAARDNKKVLLLEKLPQIGAKLKATGGGRCNLTNTLSNEEFMNAFGKHGRFMQDALNLLDSKKLIEFFNSINVKTHCPDGFRVFPITHDSNTIIKAFHEELNNLKVDILLDCKVEEILYENNKILGVKAKQNTYKALNVIVSTGGLGYPKLGSTGDGYSLSSKLGHTTTNLSPAMMPLKIKEKWVANCKADTIAKVTIKIDLPKYKKLKATDDLIFTNDGIRGPVVLDFAREITPILEKQNEVPILVNLTNGMNEDQLTKYIKEKVSNNPHATICEHLNTLLPKSVSKELCNLVNINCNDTYKKIDGKNISKLIKLLAWIPLTVIGHDGFKMAMITRGGINLKEINPKTMESKLVKGVYFCGEVVNLDGPCGGYNLQWAFSSGYLAATSTL